MKEPGWSFPPDLKSDGKVGARSHLTTTPFWVMITHTVWRGVQKGVFKKFNINGLSINHELAPLSFRTKNNPEGFMNATTINFYLHVIFLSSCYQ